MRRGEVWTAAGGKNYAGKPRPVVIVQDDRFDGTDSVTVCALTTDSTEAPLLRIAEAGEHAKAMVYAVTEGEEKPLKYPVMFRAVDVCVINKIDLLPHLDFDLDVFLANLRAVNPAATTIRTSARTGEGIEEWCSWLLGQVAAGS